jgi:hypothetical protein
MGGGGERKRGVVGVEVVVVGAREREREGGRMTEEGHRRRKGRDMTHQDSSPTHPP